MASLYLESLPGVCAEWKPLQPSVKVSTEHAPPQGLYVEVSHVHCNSSCWNFLAKVSQELFSRAGINAALLSLPSLLDDKTTKAAFIPGLESCSRDTFARKFQQEELQWAWLVSI